MNLPDPRRQQLRALLFDFDGTLLDSFAAHYRAYEVALAHFNIELTTELFKRTYSPDWYATYRALNIPEELWEEADRRWLAEARNHQPALFAGARSFLAQLIPAYQLGLVTSGSRERVVCDLARTGISDFFEVIITGDDVSAPKPAPEGLLAALQRLQVQPDQALFIGDAREDCEMARLAGVAFVGIASEFATVTAVEDCALLSRLSDLLPYIASDPPGQE